MKETMGFSRMHLICTVHKYYLECSEKENLIFGIALDMQLHSDDEAPVPDSSDSSEEKSLQLIDDIETVYHPYSGLSP